MRLLLFLLLNKLLLAVDVHVVPEDVEKLVQLEVTLLTNFGSTDEETLERVASEIAEFTSHGQIFQLTKHPLNVLFLYEHWLRHASFWPRLQNVPKDEMEAFRSQLPSSEDVRGVADHVLRLRSVYNLTTEHVLSGRLMGLEALRPMRMQECFLLVDVAYQGLLLDEFKLWYEACQAMTEAKTSSLASSQQNMYASRLQVMEALAEEGQLSDLLTSSGQHKSPMWEEYKRLCRTTIDSGAAAASSGLDQGYCFVDQFFYKIEVLSFYPLVVRVYQLVSPVEADLIRVAAAPHLHQPKTVSAKSGVIKSKSATRSGKVAFLNQELEVLAKLKKTTGLVTGLNTLEEEASEALQVVHYAVGGHYEPHVDYFGAHSVEDSRGDRVATVLFYLSENMLGGGTVFPLLNLAVKPVQGSALIWYNTQRNALEGEMLTLHAGCPVIFGRKWIANLWLRQRPQIFHRPCPLFDE